jgi:hypothetical protein
MILLSFGEGHIPLLLGLWTTDDDEGATLWVPVTPATSEWAEAA